MHESEHNSQQTPVDRSLKPLRGVIGFTLCYTIAASLFSFAQGNGEFAIYIAVMLVVAIALWQVFQRIPLSMGVLWALSIWGLAHMLGGLAPIPATWPHEGNGSVLYNLWLIPNVLKYDQLVHAYGFGVTTVVFWQVFAFMLANRTTPANEKLIRPTFGLLFICVTCGIGMGALNEVVEFVTTLFIEDTNVGDYTNTGWDLIANLVGASAAALWIRMSHRQPADRDQGDTGIDVP